MKNTLFLLFVLSISAPATSAPATEPASNSRMAGTNHGKNKFEVWFAPEGGQLTSIEVSTGEEYGNKVVKGFRFVRETSDRKETVEVIGTANGKFEQPIVLTRGTEVVGISGKHGLLIDSIRFHFSDGTTSAIFGGDGGPDEYSLLLSPKDGKYVGRVSGLFGLVASEAVSGIGLMMLGGSELDSKLELTIRGEVDADFALTVGRLAAHYYECYPELLKRFENPMNPASRKVVINFEPKLPFPAAASNNGISISVAWLKEHPDDIGLLTHELTHVVQQYPAGSPGWLTEGIADYARYKYGPKIQPGWKLPPSFTKNQTYKDGYGTAAVFLLWLEHQHPGIVDHLNRLAQTSQFVESDIEKFTGKTVQMLWEDCRAATINEQ